MVRDRWRGFVFSLAYGALHPKKTNRILGPKEKEAMDVMVSQHAAIGAVVRARWLTLGSSGHQFARRIADHYQRSVVDVKVLNDGPENTAATCELHCALAKQSIRANDARRVLIRYRGPGGVVHEALPMIVGREWAERIKAWFDIVQIDDRIETLARKMFADETKGTLVFSKELTAQWKDVKIPAIAQLVSQDDEIFERYCKAISVWIDGPRGDVWPGWFK